MGQELPFSAFGMATLRYVGMTTLSCVGNVSIYTAMVTGQKGYREDTEKFCQEDMHGEWNSGSNGLHGYHAPNRRSTAMLSCLASLTALMTQY